VDEQPAMAEGPGGLPEAPPPAIELERRLREAGPEELLALVRQRAAELSPAAVRQALRNPYVTSEVIGEIAAQERLLVFYEVRRDLARCPATPETLALRLERHCANALEIARWLEEQSEIKSVHYPGLKSHPQHDLARLQMRGFGGMVTIVLKTDLAGTRRFLENTELFALAESLGGVESLINHPALMTHASVPEEKREKLGVTNSLVRLSVGVEDVRDLIDDLKFALEAI